MADIFDQLSASVGRIKCDRLSDDEVAAVLPLLKIQGGAGEALHDLLTKCPVPRQDYALGCCRNAWICYFNGHKFSRETCISFKECASSLDHCTVQARVARFNESRKKIFRANSEASFFHEVWRRWVPARILRVDADDTITLFYWGMDRNAFIGRPVQQVVPRSVVRAAVSDYKHNDDVDFFDSDGQKWERARVEQMHNGLITVSYQPEHSLLRKLRIADPGELCRRSPYGDEMCALSFAPRESDILSFTADLQDDALLVEEILCADLAATGCKLLPAIDPCGSNNPVRSMQGMKKVDPVIPGVPQRDQFVSQHVAANVDNNNADYRRIDSLEVELPKMYRPSRSSFTPSRSSFTSVAGFSERAISNESSSLTSLEASTSYKVHPWRCRE